MNWIDRHFVPDWYGDDIYAIRAETLALSGVRGVILDIDNTLVPYEVADPTDEVRAWLAALREAGIGAAFVSNNSDPTRVDRFNRTLGLFALSGCHKPGTGGLRAAMAAMGTDAASTAMIGDQVFTDVWAGRRLGLTTYLVKPIRDKKTLFFRFKRLLERPVLRRYRRRARKREEGR